MVLELQVKYFILIIWNKYSTLELCLVLVMILLGTQTWITLMQLAVRDTFNFVVFMNHLLENVSHVNQDTQSILMEPNAVELLITVINMSHLMFVQNVSKDIE